MGQRPSLEVGWEGRIEVRGQETGSEVTEGMSFPRRLRECWGGPAFPQDVGRKLGQF